MNITRYNLSGGSAVFDDSASGLAYADSLGYTETTAPPQPASVLNSKITKRAFQSRFPVTPDTVSTKYDLMTLFLSSDSYADSLGVTGATLHGLRSMIITGKNRLDASPYVDYEAPDATRFTQLMAAPSIPAAFRLTAAQRAAILSVPISDLEVYR